MKALRHAELGIRHYWLVDGGAGRIACHRLVDGAFEVAVEASAGDMLVHPDFDGLAVRLSDLSAESETPMP